MEISTDFRSRQGDLTALFARTFTASEGPEEGALIEAFVADLFATTPEQDLRVFTALDGTTPIGSICFTPLRFEDDTRRVALLSPVAVATQAQGKGVGQALLRHGLEALRREGVDVAITYGDPAFYGKVGFRPITEEDARPPLPLSHPEGWIGQSLTDAPLTPLQGPSRCVAALDSPDLW